MLYSSYLQHPKVIEAMKAARLDNVSSSLADFSLPGEEIQEEFISRIIDGEILNRRKAVELESKIQEYKKNYEPQLKIEKKIEFIRPHVEALIKGKLKNPYDTAEAGVVAVLSEYCAKHFEFEPGEDESTQEDFSGLNELQVLLKRSSITKLTSKMSIEEVALRGLHRSELSKFLK